jgi:hypothetical protein
MDVIERESGDVVCIRRFSITYPVGYSDYGSELAGSINAGN